MSESSLSSEDPHGEVQESGRGKFIGLYSLVASVMSNSFQSYGLRSPLGSSVRGILQARALEWVAMPSSRGSSQPRDRTHVSYTSCCLNSLGGETFIWELGQRQRSPLPFILSTYFQKPPSHFFKDQAVPME